jgi:hypothetical protein
MGADFNFTCKTCLKTYRLGYDSYSNWLITKCLEDYDALNDRKGKKQYTHNQNFRQCLVEHDKHDWMVWSGDCGNYESGNDLCADHGRYTEIVIKDFALFEKIDMEVTSD